MIVVVMQLVREEEAAVAFAAKNQDEKYSFIFSWNKQIGYQT